MPEGRVSGVVMAARRDRGRAWSGGGPTCGGWSDRGWSAPDRSATAWSAARPRRAETEGWSGSGVQPGEVRLGVG